jgi:DNA uptake protein ComE-like DNA-binding protein
MCGGYICHKGNASISMFGGTMALPQLTDEQRKAALEKAAQARHARAELRSNIKSGKVTLEEVLNSDDPIANRMKVSALIESLPGYGKAKATKIMDELNISPSRRVKGLGARQREQLLEVLSK